LADLFHEAGERNACGQKLEAFHLPEHGFQTFGQDGFIAIQKNSRHNSPPSKKQIRAVNAALVFQVFVVIGSRVRTSDRFSPELSLYLLRLSITFFNKIPKIIIELPDLTANDEN
jgi:hypothetical protein